MLVIDVLQFPSVGGYLVELETKVHPKVRNHGEGPY